MKFLKTDFSRVHFVVMLFGLINVLMGIALTTALIPYQTAALLHWISGLLLLPLLLLLPGFFKNRKMLYQAFKSRLTITKRDIARKKTLLILAKIDTVLMLLGFVILLISALLLKTGLAYQMFPNFNLFMFHVRFVYVMPVLVALHPILMLSAKWKAKSDAHQKPL